MLKPLKFSTKEHKVFFTSDLHLNHNKEFLYGKRGYKSMQEHDAGVIKIWNERVGENDIVINLGDFIFYQKDSVLTKEYINKLNGKQFFLWGNHNAGVKPLYFETMKESLFNPDVYEVYPLTWNNKFTFCGNYIYGKIDHISFVGSHYSFRIWDGMSKGVILASGHSHSNDVLSNPETADCKRLDVGIDVFKKIVSFREIQKIMAHKEIKQLDHHRDGIN